MSSSLCERGHVEYQDAANGAEILDQGLKEMPTADLERYAGILAPWLVDRRNSRNRIVSI
jgi:hypothetical protein